MNGPLEGIKVIDVSRVLAGPVCSMNLGDMGADVIKVERPDGGDDTRAFGPPFLNDVSTYYLSINRNKRSIGLNLKSEEGKALLWRLIEDADVLLENFRPGTMERLGFSYADCMERNPRLVYCSISAFGHDGHPDWSRRPGYDLIIQGMGGIPSITGAVDGGPSKVGASIADIVSGMNAFTGILLALFARERTGRGQKVDTSMLDGQVSLLTYLSSAWLNTNQVPPRMGNRHLSIAPYSTYEAADGWLNIAVANQKLWVRFADILGDASLASDPRFSTNPQRVAHVETLDALINEALSTDTVDTWVRRFDDAGIPAGPVLTLDQVLSHTQLKARSMIEQFDHPRAGRVRVTGIPHRLDDTPGSIRRGAPELGEHTDELLTELGLSPANIARLRQEGVVA